jgi:glutamine cyclotransferase
MKKYYLLVLLALNSIFSCSGGNGPVNQASKSTDQIQNYRPQIYHTFTHDADAFTQGLFYSDGFLYESTGNYGESSLRKVEIESGKVINKYDLPSDYFGEGIALCNDKIIQLTWLSKKGFVYDIDSLALIGEFNYPTEGWGITYNGKYLIMSDGTDILYFLDPVDFSRVNQIVVRANGKAITRLNELEYINGKIYANIWQTDQIAIIQPDGKVIGWIDLKGILPPEDCPREIDVLNGIAYNAEENMMYVTGKYWCKLFELEVVP